MSIYARSPAPNPIPLENLGRYPLYRIKIPPDFLDLLVGATLGNRYNVLSVIGRGGMSVVYKAKEIDTQLIVAVKTLRTQSLTDEMVVKRFQREAELLSRLNHPRIVNLHAYGTSSRGQPYFVMDFLQGDNLVTVLKRDDHLDPERFQDIFVQVCAAIEHAHRHGAIHRDIKPGNIMLTRTKRTKDYVKVVDFGIAKLAEEAQKLTRMGEVWGSPIYMSPEQCMGAAIDARSDIYSLGIVMYECLTGRVPFLGRNYADTMGKQISETPPTFKKIRPDLDIPESLEAIVMMALAKEPEHRYQSLTQMRKDLESALSAQPSASITIPPKMMQGKGPGKAQPGGQASPTARASDNKMKAADNASKKESRPTQSKSNLRAQTNPDMERPRKNSTTKSRLEPAVLNPHRLRNLILIAGGSLLATASLIAVFTHGDQVASVVASVLKQVVGGSEDDQKTSPDDGAGTGTSGTTEEKDPQQALQEWLTPGGSQSSTGTATDSSGQSMEDLKQQQEDEALKVEQEQQRQEQLRQDEERKRAEQNPDGQQ
ncbi:MAG: serine/threonine protein kinase [Cyanobacteria bacterium SZAS LIN-2]|nr:serine/threonine protein kinase [Cyanobacteria bacterium SZAS LIN-2]